MSTHSSHQIEIDPSESIGAFILAFWPVSFLMALLEHFFYDGPGAVPINLAAATLAGWVAVRKRRADLRRREEAA